MIAKKLGNVNSEATKVPVSRRRRRRGRGAEHPPAGRGAGGPRQLVEEELQPAMAPRADEPRSVERL